MDGRFDGRTDAHIVQAMKKENSGGDRWRRREGERPRAFSFPRRAQATNHKISRREHYLCFLPLTARYNGTADKYPFVKLRPFWRRRWRWRASPTAAAASVITGAPAVCGVLFGAFYFQRTENGRALRMPTAKVVLLTPFPLPQSPSPIAEDGRWLGHNGECQFFPDYR